MTKKELKTELDKRGLLFSAGPREIFVKGFGVLTYKDAASLICGQTYNKKPKLANRAWGTFLSLSNAAERCFVNAAGIHALIDKRILISYRCAAGRAQAGDCTMSDLGKFADPADFLSTADRLPAGPDPFAAIDFRRSLGTITIDSAFFRAGFLPLRNTLRNIRIADGRLTLLASDGEADLPIEGAKIKRLEFGGLPAQTIGKIFLLADAGRLRLRFCEGPETRLYIIAEAAANDTVQMLFLGADYAPAATCVETTRVVNGLEFVLQEAYRDKAFVWVEMFRRFLPITPMAWEDEHRFRFPRIAVMPKGIKPVIKPGDQSYGFYPRTKLQPGALTLCQEVAIYDALTGKPCEQAYTGIYAPRYRRA